eukprot:5587421-Pyramimonas_sp.AAC.1
MRRSLNVLSTGLRSSRLGLNARVGGPSAMNATAHTNGCACAVCKTAAPAHGTTCACNACHTSFMV